MSYYQDLSDCDYFGAPGTKPLLAVGWLDIGMFVTPMLVVVASSAFHAPPSEALDASSRQC